MELRDSHNNNINMPTRSLYHLAYFSSPHLMFLSAAGIKLEPLEFAIQQLMKAFPTVLVSNPKSEVIYCIWDTTNLLYKRAYILSIAKEEYICWLLDYGSIVNVKDLYSFPKNCDILPRCICVGLYNIVGLDININSIGGIDLKPTLKFTISAQRVILTRIIKADQIYFQEEKIINNIAFGQLNLVINNKCYNLVEQLIQDKIVIVEENLFNRAITIDKLLANKYKEDFPLTPKPKVELDLTEGVGRAFSRKKAMDKKPGEPDEQSPSSLLNLIKGRGRKIKSDLNKQHDETFQNFPKVSDTLSSCEQAIEKLLIDEEVLNANVQEDDDNFMKRMKEKMENSKLSNMCPKTDGKMDESDSAEFSTTESDHGDGKKITKRTLMLRKLQQKNKLLSKSKDELSTVDKKDVSKPEVKTESAAVKRSNMLKLLKEKHGKVDTNKEDAKKEELKNTNDPSNPFGLKQSTTNVPLKLIPAGMSTTSKKVDKLKRREKSSNVNRSNSSISSKTNSTSPPIRYSSNLRNNVELHNSTSSISSSECDIPTHCTNNPRTDVLKIGCNCKTCKYWNTSGLSAHKKEEFEVKKRKKIIKPIPLLKEKDDDSIMPEIKTMTYITDSLSHSNKITASQILVHGSLIPYPQKSIKDIPFLEPIHEALNSYGYKNTKPIQSYGWHTVLRNLNILLIDGPNTGKTLTYIPALCSFMLEKDSRYKDMHNSNGPIAIILCPESSNAEKVHQNFISLLRKIKGRDKMHMIFALPPMEKATIKLFSTPCDILITTPTTLIALISKNIINFKRLCHFVVEKLDIILSNFKNALKEILRVMDDMLKRRTFSNHIQLIFTSEHWTNSIEQLINTLYRPPIICIGNHLESAIYGRACFFIHDPLSKVKAEKLYENIKDIYQTYKSIVVCDKDEIKDITDLFQLYGIRMISADESMSGQDIVDAVKPWIYSRNGENIVMVCTDSILKTHLNITNASVLVNYSLPNTWSAFLKRFTCLIDNYKSPLSKNSDDTFNCKIHTFVDEKCAEKFPRIAKFFLSNGIKLSSKYHELLDNCDLKEEQMKIKTNVLICENIKSFGYCKIDRCAFRHKLSASIDVHPDLPKSGLLKYKILDIRHVNKYIIRPISYKIDKGEEIMINDYKREINELFNNKSAMEFSREILENGLYAVEIDKQWHRCIVKKILEKELITNAASRVQLEALDSGFLKDFEAADIYDLPEELQKIPKTCFELYVTNITPTNKDSNWSNRAAMFVSKILESNKYKKKSIFACNDIVQQIGSTFWVDDLSLQENLMELKMTLNSFNLRRFLIEKNLVDVTTKPLDNIRKLCEEAGIEICDYKKVTVNTSKMSQTIPQWAFLSEDGYSNVYFSSGCSPSRFYVKLIQFEKLFYNLQKEIQESIEDKFHRPLKKSEIEIGSCYLAPDVQDGCYCRVLVIDIISEQADCFFVDYGDYALIKFSKLKYLRNDLITKLPYQAIECSLYGVQSANAHWDNEATDVLYEYCFEGNSDFFRRLNTCCLKVEMGTFTNNRAHKILLLDYTSTNKVVINNILIDCGFALGVEGENLDVDLSEFEKEMALNEEEVSDEECFENYSELSPRALKDALKSVDTNEKYVEPDYIDSDEDYDYGDFDVQIPDPRIFYQECVRKEEKLPAINSAKEVNVIKNKDTLHPMRALPKSQSNIFTPEIVWYQTNTHVKIEIKLSGVEEYTLKIRAGKIFEFSTNHNGKDYGLNFQLHKSVEKDFNHIGGGLTIRVDLSKKGEATWPKLIFGNETMRNIKYNLEKCVTEEKKKKLLELGLDDKEFDLGDDWIFEYGSDDDYFSESDIDEESE